MFNNLISLTTGVSHHAYH